MKNLSAIADPVGETPSMYGFWQDDSLVLPSLLIGLHHVQNEQAPFSHTKYNISFDGFLDSTTLIFALFLQKHQFWYLSLTFSVSSLNKAMLCPPKLRSYDFCLNFVSLCPIFPFAE